MPPKKQKPYDDEGKDGKEEKKYAMMHPEDIKNIIPKFDGGDLTVNRWIKKIEKYKQIYQWDDEAALLYAITRLGGTPKLWFDAVEDEIYTFEDFKRKIKTSFGREVDETDIHFRLSEMVYEKNQTYENFAMRLFAMGKTADLTETSIVKYILRGLSRDPVYEWVAHFEYDSVLNLIEKIKWAESNMKIKLGPKSYNPRAEVAQSGFNEKFPIREGYRQRNNATFKCFNCGSTTHRADKCDQPVKCFNCLETGHKSLSCTKPQRVKRCSVCKSVKHTDERCPARNTAKPAETTTKMYNLEKESTPTVAGLDQKISSIQVNQDGMVECQVILQNKILDLNILIDLGSGVSVLKEAKLDKLSLANLDFVDNKLRISGINDSRLIVKGKVSALVSFERQLFPVNFLIVPNESMKVDAIIGRDFINSNDFVGVGIVREVGSSVEISEYDSGKVENTVDGKTNFDISLMNEIIKTEESLFLEI